MKNITKKQHIRRRERICRKINRATRCMGDAALDEGRCGRAWRTRNLQLIAREYGILLDAADIQQIWHEAEREGCTLARRWSQSERSKLLDALGLCMRLADDFVPGFGDASAPQKEGPRRTKTGPNASDDAMLCLHMFEVMGREGCNAAKAASLLAGHYPWEAQTSRTLAKRFSRSKAASERLLRAAVRDREIGE